MKTFMQAAEAKSNKWYIVDATNMPVEIFEAFEDYYERKETNIVFFEVGEFDVSQIKVGEL